MKKLVTLILCIACILAMAFPAAAAQETGEVGTRIGYLDISLDDLSKDNGIMPLATTASKDLLPGTVTGSGSGTFTGKSATVKLSGAPAGATITNVQAYTPSSSNITTSTYTGIENIQVYKDNVPSGYFRYYSISAPTLAYPCKTSTFNGDSPNGTYQIELQAKSASGSGSFTARGTIVRVTYKY